MKKQQHPQVRARERKNHEKRQWLDELERSVKAPAKEQLWGTHAAKDEELPPIQWDRY